MYTVINVITTVCNNMRYESIHRVAGIGSIGRERPHELFGRLKAEKVGSLPPVFVVFRPPLLIFLLCMFLCLRTFGGERVKTLVQTRLKCEILTFFTKKPRLPLRYARQAKSRSVETAGNRVAPHTSRASIISFGRDWRELDVAALLDTRGLFIVCVPHKRDRCRFSLYLPIQHLERKMCRSKPEKVSNFQNS
jgi:hypothetical protein